METTTQLKNPEHYVMWTQTTAVYMEKTEALSHTKIKETINKRFPRLLEKMSPEDLDKVRIEVLEDVQRDYVFLGLLDEIGEVSGMLKREIRDGVKRDRHALMLEMGDIAWYLARIHYDHTEELPEGQLSKVVEYFGLKDYKGTCFGLAIELMEKARPIFNDKMAAMSFISSSDIPDFKPDGSRESINDVLRFLNDLPAMMHRASENVQDPVKKHVGTFIINMSKRMDNPEKVVGSLLHIAAEAENIEAIFTWYTLCLFLKFEPLEVLQANVDKLESRKERGTLHGKGSER